VQVELSDTVVAVSPKWRQFLHVSGDVCSRRSQAEFRELNAAPAPSRLCVLPYAAAMPDEHAWLKVRAPPPLGSCLSCYRSRGMAFEWLVRRF
jgi:hypothetical protein